MDLFGNESFGDIGDPLDRHYTPDALARVIVERLACHIPEPRIVLEPSVGGGAFVRAVRRRWPRAMVIGVDIDPRAAGLALCDESIVGDFTSIDWTPNAFDLVLGNPPFSRDTALRHVTTAKAVADTVCLLLPWSYLGGVDRWGPHMDGAGAPGFAWTVAPRPWGDRLRESAAYLWPGDGRGTRVQALKRWKP